MVKKGKGGGTPSSSASSKASGKKVAAAPDDDLLIFTTDKKKKGGPSNKNGGAQGSSAAPDGADTPPGPPKPTVKQIIGGQSWTGKLPVNLLSEHCQKMKWERPDYDTVRTLCTCHLSGPSCWDADSRLAENTGWLLRHGYAECQEP